MEMVIHNVMKKKTSTGRRKVEMKKIEKRSSLQTSFSKRKQGVFNKAAELSMLTGAHVSVIVKSPAGRKFYAFGSPSSDYMFDRFLSQTPNVNVTNFASNSQVKQAIERNKELEAKRDVIQAGEKNWLEQDLSGLNLCELEKFASALEILRHRVLGRAYQLTEIENYPL